MKTAGKPTTKKAKQGKGQSRCAFFTSYALLLETITLWPHIIPQAPYVLVAQ